MNDPIIMGVYCGLTFCIPYLVIHAFRKNPPSFNEIAVIILSCVGGLVGIDFGYVVMTATATYLGNLETRRLPMMLGAIAVIWTSIESLFRIYYPLLISRRRNVRETDQLESQGDGVD